MHYTKDKKMGKYRVYQLKIVARNKGNDYDYALEKMVIRFNLLKKTRKQEVKDILHFTLLFWKKNRKLFIKYTSFPKVAKLFNIDHTSVMHYVGRHDEDNGARKKSNNWAVNVSDAREYLLDVSCAMMKKNKSWKKM